MASLTTGDEGANEAEWLQVPKGGKGRNKSTAAQAKALEAAVAVAPKEDAEQQDPDEASLKAELVSLQLEEAGAAKGAEEPAAAVTMPSGMPTGRYEYNPTGKIYNYQELYIDGLEATLRIRNGFDSKEITESGKIWLDDKLADGKPLPKVVADKYPSLHRILCFKTDKPIYPGEIFASYVVQPNGDLTQLSSTSIHLKNGSSLIAYFDFEKEKEGANEPATIATPSGRYTYGRKYESGGYSELCIEGSTATWKNSYSDYWGGDMGSRHTTNSERGTIWLDEDKWADGMAVPQDVMQEVTDTYKGPYRFLCFKTDKPIYTDRFTSSYLILRNGDLAKINDSMRTIYLEEYKKQKD
eukprot:CAMPEP_0172599154 /NCGR_PEP_ID=MMETSP1068-20121228/19233_1 /TAXON_ID=35684 /ORGANISM="Pseudopedinella elastica, Strain CCMP716" /LENGTH=354 /DNA_ID=CAMNT_0013399313 /DNA_START=82 /DNA_END=1146 /DNA_ORIENTATION=+